MPPTAHSRRDRIFLEAALLRELAQHLARNRRDPFSRRPARARPGALGRSAPPGLLAPLAADHLAGARAGLRPSLGARPRGAQARDRAPVRRRGAAHPRRDRARTGVCAGLSRARHRRAAPPGCRLGCRAGPGGRTAPRAAPDHAAPRAGRQPQPARGRSRHERSAPAHAPAQRRRGGHRHRGRLRVPPRRPGQGAHRDQRAHPGRHPRPPLLRERHLDPVLPRRGGSARLRAGALRHARPTWRSPTTSTAS